MVAYHLPPPTTAHGRLSYAASSSSQAIRLSIELHEANRANRYLGTSAGMALVWADRESTSYGLNTIEQASGCNDETLRLFRSIVLASLACKLHVHYSRATHPPKLPTEQYHAVWPLIRSLKGAHAYTPIGYPNTPRI